MQFKLRPLQRTNFNGLEVLTRSQLASEAQLSAKKKKSRYRPGLFSQE